MKLYKLLSGLLVLTGLMLVTGRPNLYRRPHHSERTAGLANATILIIRHAEKPADGAGLAPAGQRRARAYAQYFQHFTVGGQPFHISHLFAAADSRNSSRPRLTVEPLSHATGLAIDNRFKNKDSIDLEDELQTHNYGKHILICWHHGEIPELLQAIGADPTTLLPGGEWPSEVYDWVLELRYDANGRLIPGETKRIAENLMPGDAVAFEPQPSK